MPLNSVAQEAISGLKGKMLGGIDKDSAVRGIKTVQEAGEKQIRRLSDTVSSQSARITGLSNDVKNAQKELQSANATESYLRTQLSDTQKSLTETAETLTKTEGKLAKAQAIKEGTSTLEGGSTQVIKVNKNGTQMKKIIAPNGNKESVEVTQLDGSVRKTEYDVASGKRIQTTTNTNGDVTIEYDMAGKTSKISGGKKEAPTVVKRDVNKAKTQITEQMSDGTTIVRNELAKGHTRMQKLDDKGHVLEEMEEKIYQDRTESVHFIRMSDKEFVTTRVYDYGNGNMHTAEKRVVQDEYGNSFASYVKIANCDGELVFKPSRTDMFGNIIGGESTTTYKLTPNKSFPTRAVSAKTTYEIESGNSYYGPSVYQKEKTIYAENGNKLVVKYDKGRECSRTYYDKDNKVLYSGNNNGVARHVSFDKGYEPLDYGVGITPDKYELR